MRDSFAGKGSHQNPGSRLAQQKCSLDCNFGNADNPFSDNLLSSSALSHNQTTQRKENKKAGADSQNQPVTKNKTGLPDHLKQSIESLSGYSMDDVNVHFNSGKPAQLQAHAYAQGNNIHIAPGKESHLPHEAWHVVQQKQGRVKPTVSEGNVKVNNDTGLEHEADTMGSKAAQFNFSGNATQSLSTSVAPSAVCQLVKVDQSDVGKYYSIVRDDNGQQDTGKLVSINGGGWYTFEVSGGVQVNVRGQDNILVQVNAPAVNSFTFNGISFTSPTDYTFTATSALNATKPIPYGGWSTITGGSRNSGVSIGDYGSYGGVQYLEKTGDGLTGDHQPSGAAIKEAIRLKLHSSLNQVLTRQMASNAYKKAITIVMTDKWHKAQSRTYGGRNTSTQISDDAQDLVQAAISDWQLTVPELKKHFTDQEIQNIWDGLNDLRKDFFATGDAQYM